MHRRLRTVAVAGVAVALFATAAGCGGETTYLFTPRQARALIAGSPALPDRARRAAADASAR